MFYSKILAVSFVFATTLVQAGDLTAYSTGKPSATYFIQNNRKEIIFYANNDLVQTVSLQDGYGVVQTIMQNVSWVSEDANTAGSHFLVENAYGSNYKVSDTLLAVYFPQSVGKVFDRSGKVIFQDVNTQGMSVAHSYFAWIDSFDQSFTIRTAAAPKTDYVSQSDIVSAQLSENFYTTIDRSNQFSLYSMQGPRDALANDSNIDVTKLALSDQFAGYFDSTGALRIYSTNGKLFLDSTATQFGLNDSFFYVVDALGISFYNTNQERIYSTASYSATAPDAFAISQTLFAIRLDSLRVAVGDAQGDFTILNQADQYVLSEKLFMVKNGPSEFITYAFTSDGNKKIVYQQYNQNINGFQIGEQTVAIQYAGLGYGTNPGESSADVFDLSSGDLNSSPLLFHADQVDLLQVTKKADQLNWTAF